MAGNNLVTCANFWLSVMSDTLTWCCAVSNMMVLWFCHGYYVCITFLTICVATLAWSQYCLFYDICYYELLLLNMEKKWFKLFELLIPMHVSVFIRNICWVFSLNIPIVSWMACATNFASQLRYSGWPHKTVPLANLCHCAYRDERHIGASASDWFPQTCATWGKWLPWW